MTDLIEDHDPLTQKRREIAWIVQRFREAVEASAWTLIYDLYDAGAWTDARNVNSRDVTAALASDCALRAMFATGQMMLPGGVDEYTEQSK